MEQRNRQERRTGEAISLCWQSPDWYRATTLTERIAALPPGTSLQLPSNAESLEQARQRLQRWKAQPPFDRSSLFAKRLALDGLSETDFLALLAEPVEELQARMSRTTDTPNWLVLLQEAFAAFDASKSLPLPLLSLEERRAFACVLPFQPLMQTGLNRVEQGVQHLLARYDAVPFDPDTIAALLFTGLAQRLTPKISRTFALELQVAHLRGHLSGETDEARFHSYLDWLREPFHLHLLLQEYCVLARQLVISIEQWVQFSLQWLDRLCADWHVMREVFAVDGELGVLTTIAHGTGATDEINGIHRGGRNVLILTFSSGWRLVYKPRSLAIDVHFQQLLSWLNSRGQQPAFRTLKLLDRGSYGWSEFVEADSCRSEEELTHFYERRGAYVALLYALGANIQAEDIIAAGEHPLLVNLGTLFQSDMASVAGDGTQQSQHPAESAFNESVLRVGLLSNELEADSCDHASNVITGFTRLYHLLIKHRDELITTVLPRFAHDEIRFLARPTTFYTSLLSGSFHPDVLRDALLRDRYFDRLWLTVKEQPHLQQLIAAERAALLQNDIPVFATCPASRDLFTRQEVFVPAFFAESGLAMVNRRLSLFNAEHLARQLWLIRGSFTGVSMSAHPAMEAMLTLRPGHAPATSAQMIEAARAVGERLASHAVFTETATGMAAGWLGMTIVKGGKWRVRPTGPGLYKGTAGIALFLAYLGHVTGDIHYTRVARAALATVRIELQRQSKTPGTAAIGAFDGLAAYVYLFTHLGVLLNEPLFFQQAHELVMRLHHCIEKDDKLDVLAGSAGCILSLLSLYDVDPTPTTLSIAMQCGHHLLAHAQHMQQGVGWRTSVGKIPLTGLSHGTAGIVLSLLALAAVSGQEQFRTMAQAGLTYERSLFSPEQQNWPDLVSCANEQEARQAIHKLPYLHKWCHGAPGIGLARLASLPYLDDAQMRADIDAALNTTIEHGFGYNHSLCHGDFGNLETLLVATHMLERQRDREQVARITAMLLDSIETDGRKTGIPQGAETPGLMNGLAGIGYELLRLAASDKVPSVLLLAPPCSDIPFPASF